MGQTGEELRAAGYTGRIVSFEPLRVPFVQLKSKADADGSWTANQAAVGSTAGTAQINVSGTHWSSSFLPMADRHKSMVPESEYTGVETVKVETVDRIFDSAVGPSDRVMLKIDTQGFELPVLEGSANSLKRIALVQAELSLVLLYDGQPKYYDVMKYMDEAGFEIANIIPSFFEKKTSQFLQADALFVRKNG
jgi:FkbM family methyltransferase